MISRLKKEYVEKIKPALKDEFGYNNDNAIPKLEKIVLNMGVGDNVQDSKRIRSAVTELEAIAGQKVIVNRAKKSIAQFKLREDMPIGCKVTLRGERMYEFLDRLVNIAMPRIRDFRGISDKSFDGRGNYALGIKEQIIFPEVDYDKVSKIRGLDVVICTTAKTDEEALALLKGFNMPFKGKK